MSVQVSYRTNLTVLETLSSNVPGATDPTITHDAFNTSLSLNADAAIRRSLYPINATKCAIFEHQGNGTINLKSLSGTNGALVNANTLHLICYKLRCPDTNIMSIEVGEGATNGFPIFGAGKSIEMMPGQEMQFFYSDASPQITTSDRNIDVQAEGGDVLQCMFVFGDIDTGS